jgi:hypothetical protein
MFEITIIIKALIKIIMFLVPGICLGYVVSQVIPNPTHILKKRR